MAACSRGGMVAPQVAVNRSTCSTLVKGMIPGSTGAWIPAARARATNPSKAAFWKKSWVTRKSAPASTLALRWRRSASRSRVSGWPSG